MKYISMPLIFLGAIFLFAFAISKEKSLKKRNIFKLLVIKNVIRDTIVNDTEKKDAEILFDYPDDILDKDKPGFVKKIKKGKILYNINCSKCHNTTANGQPVIPDFSLPQLMDYEIRIEYPPNHEDLRETNVSAEELDLIVDFLRYKKKTGVEAKL